MQQAKNHKTNINYSPQIGETRPQSHHDSPINSKTNSIIKNITTVLGILYSTGTLVPADTSFTNKHSAPTADPATIFTNTDIDTDVLKKTYEEGLTMVSKAANAHQSHELIKLLNFYKTHVEWPPHNTPHGQDDFPKSNGWISFVPHSHPDYTDIPVWAFTSPQHDNIPATTHIKNFEISTEWAGLILTHELQHMFDLIKTNQTSEFSAYTAEMLAANMVSAGKFHQTLADIGLEEGITSDMDIDDIVKHERSRFIKICSRLENSISQTSAKSRQEQILRHGFCPQAFKIYYIDKQEKRGDPPLQDK